jgi:hypothetical protein
LNNIVRRFDFQSIFIIGIVDKKLPPTKRVWEVKQFQSIFIIGIVGKIEAAKAMGADVKFQSIFIIGIVGKQNVSV